MSFKSSFNNSTSFEVDFESSNKHNPIKMPEKFVRKHWRNLSLPINTGAVRYQMSKNGVATNGIRETNGSANSSDNDKDKKNTKINETDTDSSSEGGTYTLDKNNEEIKSARSSIDKIFGIKMQMQENTNKTALVNEWVRRNTPSPTASSRSLASSFRLQRSLSKIPSPVVTRRNSGSTSLSTSAKTSFQKFATLNQNKISDLCHYSNENETALDTECYLRETESIVCALQKRLDSGTDSSDTDSIKKKAERFNTSSACSYLKTENDKPLSTHYNRAFSLRRDRLNKSNSDIKTAIPVRQKKETAISKCVNSREGSNSDLSASSNKNYSRLTSSSTMLHRSSQCSSLTSVKKQLKDFKNKVTGSKGNRSNTTLSLQEIEFQNWKRRKSYDPMKAAAEGKKKSLEKKNSSLMSRSVSSALGDCSSVSRSASFHATQGNDAFEGYTSAEENEVFNGVDKDDEWKIPKPPSTSLENSPPGSRLSLLSNASSSSLLFSNIESVDTATVTGVLQISVQMKQASCRLLEKLSSTFKNENKKNILSAEMEQLTRCDSTPLPPYQLSFALENLKEIYSVIQALEQVLLN